MRHPHALDVLHTAVDAEGAAREEVGPPVRDLLVRAGVGQRKGADPGEQRIRIVEHLRMRHAAIFAGFARTRLPRAQG